MKLRIEITVILMSLTMLLIVSNLAAFIPRRVNFSNDYQHQLYISWMERGTFNPASPANLSHQRIRITYYDQVHNLSIPADFDLRESKIISIREIVPDRLIQTEYPALEREYRYYLELLLFRLNSDRSFFAADLISDLNILLLIKNRDGSSVDSLSYLIERNRLKFIRIEFSSMDGNGFGYSLYTTTGEIIVIGVPDSSDLSSLLAAALRNEYNSSHIRDLLESRGVEHPITAISKNYSTLYSTTVMPAIPFSRYTGPIVPNRNLPIKEYIDTYRNHLWGREMLHNKINNPEKFLTEELPWHDLKKTPNTYRLTTHPFRPNITGDIELIKRNIRDGLVFDTHENFEVDGNKIVTLSTGDQISLSELSDLEIEIITPYLSQLNTMHRVMGTRLLNFFLIPADVPTIFVLRDPERWVSEFASYTDLILMLSHYWDDRIVHFGIERVKKVNNYIEINGFLVATREESEGFDFAEVRFALSSTYRIDLAMMTLYTDIYPSEDEPMQ